MNQNYANDITLEILNESLIEIDFESGHLSYIQQFQPPTYHFNLIFIRHGETFGNCGQSTPQGQIDLELVTKRIKNKNKRIFQGNVDSPINQLTDLGKEQAIQVADEINQMLKLHDLKPEIVFHSPLTRARETGLPFIQKFNLFKRYYVHPGIREMSFGAWDNRRVCDLPDNNLCHLFYRDQHALVKCTGINGDGIYQIAENFCEVLLRAKLVLDELERAYSGKTVILFSHSMFGAACAILLGHGQTIEGGQYLAFDGQRADGSHYTMPHSKPFLLSQCKSLLAR